MHTTTKITSSSATGTTPAAKTDRSGSAAMTVSGTTQKPAMEAAGNRQNGAVTDVWYKKSFNVTNRRSL